MPDYAGRQKYPRQMLSLLPLLESHPCLGHHHPYNCPFEVVTPGEDGNGASLSQVLMVFYVICMISVQLSSLLKKNNKYMAVGFSGKSFKKRTFKDVP